MEFVGSVFGIIAFVIAAHATQRLNKIEKILKDFDVVPKDFSSEK